MSKKLAQHLKETIIKTYKKFGNDKACLLRGKRSYTGLEIAEEIENETEFGIGMVEKLLMLTIDLVKRDKINIEDTEPLTKAQLDRLKKQTQELRDGVGLSDDTYNEVMGRIAELYPNAPD